MAAHVDILDEREPLKGSLAGSLALHFSVAAAVMVISMTRGRRDYWGDATPGGGSSMVVNVVGQVPLPSRGGVVNPVANDTKSEVPEPKPDTVKRTKVIEPEPDAIPLQSRNAPKKPSRKESSINTYRAKQIDRPNQLYSQEGQALVTPMVGMAGSGGVGVGHGSPLGDRFGYYVDMLKQKVAQKWRTGDVDPRIRSAPPPSLLSRSGATARFPVCAWSRPAGTSHWMHPHSGLSRMLRPSLPCRRRSIKMMFR